MSLSIHIIPNTQRLRSSIRDALARFDEMADGAAFLVPSFSRVARYRKLWADEAFSFGLEISTLSAWIAARWELYGDGRRIIAPIQRKLLLHRALSESCVSGGLEGLAVSPGAVLLLARMAEEALPYLIGEEGVLAVGSDASGCRNFDTSGSGYGARAASGCEPYGWRAPEGTAPGERAPEEAAPEERASGEAVSGFKGERSLTGTEFEVCTVLRRYAQALADGGFCEQSQAMAILARADWPAPPILVECASDQRFTEQRFFEELGKRTSIALYADGMSLPATSNDRAEELVELQRRLYDPDPDDPIGPTGAVLFLLPAGRYAEPLLVAESIIGYVREGDRRIALAARHPFDMFMQVSPYLVEQGVGATVSDRKTFAETDFGKMWSNLQRFLGEGPCSTFRLTDVALSPFSDISKAKAYSLDSAWRGDRACTKEQCLSDLASASVLYGRTLPLLEEGKYEQALDAFEEAVRSRFMEAGAYRAEQLSAIDRVRSCIEPAQGLGIAVDDALPYLEGMPIPLNAKTSDGQANLRHIVDVMSLDDLAEQDPCSYDTVIITDLDTVSYPVRDDFDAGDRLFEKLGIPAKEDALSATRRRFFKALSVPVGRLVCERVLNTVDAQPAYPAIMLEELLDCYRSDLISVDETDRITGLPKRLRPYAEMAGEDRLYQNLAVARSPQEIEAYEGIPPHGEVGKRAKAKIVLPAFGIDAAGRNGLSLSASAIESYLECPYKWFSLRRLRLEEPDAGFGSLEMGSFAHRLLKNFYLTFQKQASAKVTEGNIDDAKALLDELFDQHIDFQADLKRRDNPLIALTSWEEAEVASFKKKLIRYLDREARLLPGFMPRYFEYDFGNEGDLAYAGGTLHGSIDRIDVNDKGQAVIIDYKGSVTGEYAFGSTSEVPWVHTGGSEKSLVLPHKVQALLYAQAARRELGLEVVGAIYVSYGRDARVSGAFDRNVIGSGDLLGIDADSCGACADGSSDFATLLDDIETAIGYALEKLGEGYIEPYPRGKDPCGYCPVTACEARKMT